MEHEITGVCVFTVILATENDALLKNSPIYFVNVSNQNFQYDAVISNLKIESDQAEVGYWIARPYWGMGICTEALGLVIDHCFGVKGFSTLWGTYFPSNPASGRVMEKCGFVDTGRETVCPNLEVGSDQPVRVMRKDNDRLIQ